MASQQAGSRCPFTSPDLHTIRCQLPISHDGLHRNNTTVWQHPQPVLVGDRQPDLTVNTDHWVDGQVVLTGEAI